MNLSTTIRQRLTKSIRCKSRPQAAFTLVEVMVSMVILAIMLMLIAQIIGVTQKSWRSASSRLAQFREARIAFDTITRNLRQATLNSYRDFYYSGTNSNVPQTNSPGEAPTGYRRISELAFVSGQATTVVKGTGVSAESLSGHAVFFQAPLGVTDPTTSPTVDGSPAYENLKHLLCGRGYFVQFGDDTAYLPVGLASRLTPTKRFRLMEFQPPAEQNTVYDTSIPDGWFAINPAYLRPVSDKIVGLILSPRLSAGNDPITKDGANVKPTSIAPNYSYDSRQVKLGTATDVGGTQHVLPPVVKVTMIALDDASVDKLLQESGGGGAGLNVLESAKAPFVDSDAYEADLNTVKKYLADRKLNFRIFESAIVLPASGTR